jgi:hypothetical protein
MRTHSRFVALVMLFAFLAFAMVAPFSAEASRSGRRNTAIGLGAAAAGLLLTHHYVSGAVVGGAAAYSATRIHHHPHHHYSNGYYDRYGYYHRY